ncbi:MAG TPA: glycosyltransferase [Candidatus Binatia bacterium]
MSASLAPRGAAESIPLRKRLSHRLKASLFRSERLDAWIDRHAGFFDGSATRSALLQRASLRLMPERASRHSALAAAADSPATRGTMMILTLVPPEDGGGGSRPAQLAAELRRRGFAIDWRYALPIFPWPRRTRPRIDGVSVRWLGERGGAAAREPRDLRLVLLEAPHPALCREASRVDPSLLVYDAIDVWDGELGRGWYDASAERWTLERARHLIASARTLADDLAARAGRSVHLLPNAVDRGTFDPAVARPTPPDVRRGTPTVVFVGALWGEWVDLELVARLASELPEATIHLVGPAGTRALPQAPNVFALGLKAQRDVPAYLQAADVAIVPFRPGRLTDAVSPLKSFEYLAMHKPVVSTRLPELADVPGVTLADDAASFVSAVRRAAAEPVDVAAVEAFLARHTWAVRVDELLALAG